MTTQFTRFVRRSASSSAWAIAATMAMSGETSVLAKPPVELTVKLDQDRPGTLGLATIAASHHLLYDAEKEVFQFCHHPNISVLRDRLCVTWSNGLQSEDFNGQRVLWSTTGDGIHWEKPRTLVPDPDGEDGPLCAVTTGVYDSGDALVAYYSAMKRGNPAHPNHISTVYAVSSEDGRNWGTPRKIIEGFFIEKPRPLPSGRLLLNGQFPDASTCLLYSDSRDGMSGWKAASIAPFPDFKGGFPEPNWFIRKDGSIVMFFRANGVPWLYASISNDNGAVYSAPERTNFPSTGSRMAVGNLPDGRAFCIWNPSVKFGRNPLVLSLSDDGANFRSAYVLRGEPTRRKLKGTHKADGWQYASATVWRNALWVVYSVNKEDVVVSSINLPDLH